MNKLFLEKLYRWQFPLIMIGSLALAYFRQAQNSIIISLLLILWLFYGVVAFMKPYKSQFKTFYSIVWAFVLLSVIEYFINGLPFKYYYSDFRALVIPMMAVYIGMVNNDESIYKWFVLSTVFCIVVGLFLYFVQPSWYLSFKVATLEDTLRYEGSNLSELNVMDLSTSGRFSSFFPTTYPVAYFTTFSLCLALNDLYKETENRMFKSNLLLLTVLGILMLGIILTLTRVAVAYLIFLVSFYFAYGFIKKKRNRNLVRGILIAMVGIILLVFIRLSTLEYGSFVLERMGDRLTMESASELTEGSRIVQTQNVLDSWENVFLGDGLGSHGGAARAEGKSGITDEDWIRVLVEFGVVGFVGLIVAFAMTINRAFKRRKFFMAELTIVVYGVVSMFVADTMYKGVLVLIFWFAIGRIWNQSLYIKRINNNNCI